MCERSDSHHSGQLQASETHCLHEILNPQKSLLIHNDERNRLTLFKGRTACIVHTNTLAIATMSYIQFF